MEITRQKIYLATSALVIVLILLSVFLIAPLVSDIYSLADQMKTQKIKLATFELEEKNLKQLKSQQTDIDSDLTLLSKSLVSPQDSLSFILPLENVAEKTSTKQTINIVNQVDDSQSAKNKNKDETDYALKDITHVLANIKLQGEFNNLLNYLLHLENAGIYTDITELNIRAQTQSNSPSPVEEEVESDHLYATFKLRAFTNE